MDRKKFNTLMSFGLFLLLSSHSEAKKAPWLETPKLDFSWVDEDKSTGRMFVAMDSGILQKDDSLVSRLIQIAEWRSLNKSTGKPIKVSLFSDTTFAHPKKNFKTKEMKRWKENYLAEYNTESKEVWVYPALPGKKRKLAIKGLEEPSNPDSVPK